MGRKNTLSPTELRKRAKQFLDQSPAGIEDFSLSDIQKLIEELQVHQIELEMQNEALCRAQSQLEKSRNRYYDLYDFAPIGYFSLDKNGSILEANLTGATLLGCERRYLIKTIFSRFIHKDFNDTYFHHRNQAFITGKKQTCELKLLKKNGTLLWVQLESLAVKDNEDHSNQLRTTMTDITERKRVEEALQAAHDELERRVAQRTAELSNSNVLLREEINQRKRAEEAVKKSEGELRQLSSKLLDAHEEESKRIGNELHDGIAQTLSSIKFWVENARLQMTREDFRDACKSLDTVVPLIQGAVQEIRSISKNLRPSILDDLGLLPTISWLCQNFQTLHPLIGIERRIQIEEQDVPDALKIVIFRVLQESFNNIGKHSRADRVVLDLQSADGRIELIVKDNGVGFDITDALTTQKHMRGLGLASMKERTELSSGSFSVESLEGAGTTVCVAWEKGSV